MKKNQETGTGNSTHIALDIKAVITMDGKKTEFDLKYDVKLTIENIEYAVRQVAGTIARVAEAIASPDGKDGVHSMGNNNTSARSRNKRVASATA